MNDDIKEIIKKEFYKRRSIEDYSNNVTVGFPAYDESEVLAALDCLLNLRLSQGPIVKDFESQASKYMNVKYAIACNSGTSGNMLALNAMINCGYLNTGDEVIVPAATFSSVVSPIYQLGLIPVYVDVNQESWFMDHKEVENTIGEKTKVIMPVYNLGYPGEIEKIVEIAKENKMKVLEDCCEAHGGERKNIKLGSYGDVSVLSFFVAHNITTGEGGMVFTNDEKLDKCLRELREFGRTFEQKSRFYTDETLKDYDVKYVSHQIGYNVRMTDIAAAMGIEQLRKLDRLNETRRIVVNKILKIINNHPFLSSLTVSSSDKSAHYGVPILIKKDAPFTRKEICEFLEQNRIETRAMMMGCLPDQPAFRNLNHKIVGNLDFSRNLRDRAFFIGCHPALNDNQIKYLEQIFNSFFSNY